MSGVRKSLLAGVMIGIGDIVYMMSDSPLAGAVLFAVALMSIMEMNLYLYTGKIGFVKSPDDVLNCLKICVANCAATSVTVLLVKRLMNPAVAEKVRDIGNGKISKGYLSLLVGGFFCGILIHTAVVVKNRIVTIFCVAVFIVAGFEHSIADIAYFAFAEAKLHVCFLSWLCVAGGNAAGAVFAQKMRN